MLTPVTAFWIFIAWLVMLGGAVGSFLNVVVYRLPLGISLVYPPSRCPKCGKGIAWYDNVPVLGWILLRGRCRQCRNPISARYPVIEGWTALMFGAVAAVELPCFSLSEFGVIYAYHMLLLCTLLCAALMEYDGNKVPWRLFVPAMIVGVMVPVVWPTLRPVSPWLDLFVGDAMPMWLGGLVDSLAGLAVGALLGFLVWRSLGEQKSGGLALGLAGVGLFLGWESVSFIALATLAFFIPVWLGKRVLPRLRIPESMIFGVVTLAWILGTGWLLSWSCLASN